MHQIYHFILHLRLHYQFCLLSGGYLLGGLMAGTMDTYQFWMQFLNVHVLLFGGATAFNSFWDKDEGPIGGLKKPPKMTGWMHVVSLLIMYAGWIWAWQIGIVYFLVYGSSLILFWLYSTPHARWKGRPHLSLVAIGLSTGFNSVLLGALAAGGVVDFVLTVSAVGASFILLSLYPVSQIFQIKEDIRRGDYTFAGKYGLSGVKTFFVISYFSGLTLLCFSLSYKFIYPSAVLFILGTISGVIIYRIIVRLEESENDYRNVMNMKFLASFSFVIFLLLSNAIYYDWITIQILKPFY